MSALKEQIGGNHYSKLKIQPIEYIHANSIPFAEASVIKYVTRWRDKGGIFDLRKARHLIDLLIELETREGKVPALDDHIEDKIEMVWTDKELPSSGIYGDEGYTAQDMQAASLVHDAEPTLGSCDNCGKRQSDGWALMCVSCAEKVFSNENKQVECNAETCEKKYESAQAQADSETREGNDALNPEMVELCSKTESHANPDGWRLHVGECCPLENGDLTLIAELSDGGTLFGTASSFYWGVEPIEGLSRIVRWRYLIKKEQ